MGIWIRNKNEMRVGVLCATRYYVESMVSEDWKELELIESRIYRGFSVSFFSLEID